MNSSAKKERIGYIDIARAIAIFLVILGHAVNVKCRLRHIIYSFHMPLFFIISGMLLKRRKEGTLSGLGRTIRKRIFCYAVPYFIWGLIYMPLTFRNLLGLCYGSWEGLSKIGSLSSLWFLPVLLLASILTECLFFVFRKADHFDAILFLCMVGVFFVGFQWPRRKPYGWPLGINISFVAAGFMLLGYFAFQLFEFIKRRNVYMIVSLLITLALLRFVSYGAIPLHKAYMHKGAYGYGGNVACFLLNAIIESAVVILVSVILDRLHSPINKGMEYIGQNTMGILVLHKPIVTRCVRIAVKKGYSVKTLPAPLVIAVIALAAALLATAFINKLLPDILGRRR